MTKSGGADAVVGSVVVRGSPRCGSRFAPNPVSVAVEPVGISADLFDPDILVAEVPTVQCVA